MCGYGDLKGVENYFLEEIEEFKPFINFVWKDEINEKYLDKKLLTKKDFDYNGINNILGFNKVANFEEILTAHKVGFRAFSFLEETNIDKDFALKLNKINGIIDALGLNETSFYTLLENYKLPIIISSGNPLEICNHKRNVSIRRIKSIAEVGGVVGININPKQLSSNIGRYDCLESILNHIDFIISNVDENCISFGCNFENNYILPWEIQRQKDMKILKYWLEVYYGEEISQKIMYRNILRVLENTL